MYGLVIILVLMALLSASMDVLANRFKGSWFDKCGFDERFWCLSVAWTNKIPYYSKYPKWFVDSVLVIFLDGWHLLKFFYNICLAILITSLIGAGWLEFIFIYLIYTISFEVLYRSLKWGIHYDNKKTID